MVSKKHKDNLFADNLWLIGLAYFCVACVLLVPVLTVEHTQTIDLINHMARQYVREVLPQGGVLSKIYIFKWMIIPDLAIEFLVAPLQNFFSLYACARILLGVIIVLWTLAPCVLHRALWGRWSLWPLMGSLVVYNANLTWGFAAYLLTSACVVWVFAGWVWTEKDTSTRRLVIFSILSFLLYCGHLIAFGLYGVLLGGYELSKLAAQGKVTPEKLFKKGLGIAPLFVPAGLHFIYLMITHPVHQSIETLMFTFADRKLALLSPFIDGINTIGTVAQHNMATPNFLLFTGALVFFSLRNTIAVHKNMILSLLFLATAAVIMPPKLLGVSFTHFRLPFVILSLLIASVRVSEKKDAVYAVLGALLALVLVQRVSLITDNWKRYDAQSREFIEKTQFIKPGQKVLIVNRHYPSGYVEHYHTASLLVIERQAFIPNLFCGGNIFHAIGDYLRLSPPTATHPMNADLLQVALDGKSPRLSESDFSYWKTWWKDYDYVLAYQDGKEGKFYPDYLAPVAQGSYFGIYKVKPGVHPPQSTPPVKTPKSGKKSRK